MPRRFTDTNKWDDPWYCELDNEAKLMWQYLCDKCSNAGVWKINFKHMKYFCNSNKSEDEIRSIFQDRFFEFDDKWFIPKFLKFQYPKGLGSDKPAVVGVRQELLSYGNVIFSFIKQSLGNDYAIIKDRNRIEQTKEKNGFYKILESAREKLGFEPVIENGRFKMQLKGTTVEKEQQFKTQKPIIDELNKELAKLNK